MHRWHRIILPLAAAFVMAPAVAWPGGMATAAEAGNAWQKLSLRGGAGRLLTPPSGPLFATQRGAVSRSDDAGETWALVNLPPRPATPSYGLVFAVDPTNHTTMYASGAEGLYKSTNDGASWSVVVETTEMVTALAVSQADPNVIYISLADHPSVREVTRYRILRSRDAGALWELIEDLGRQCQTNSHPFQPHPFDPQRVMRAQVCNPGGSTNGALAESRDQGTSWTKRFDRARTSPMRVVGGEGAMPERFYLQLWESSTHRDLLVRSDDDGVSWSETTPPWASLVVPPEADFVQIRGVDTDLAIPNRVYAAVNVGRSTNQAASVSTFFLGRVLVSDDAGTTWRDLGFEGDSFISDLKLGIDGRNLYVSTASGVWRLPFGDRS